MDYDDSLFQEHGTALQNKFVSVSYDYRFLRFKICIKANPGLFKIQTEGINNRLPFKSASPDFKRSQKHTIDELALLRPYMPG